MVAGFNWIETFDRQNPWENLTSLANYTAILTTISSCEVSTVFKMDTFMEKIDSLVSVWKVSNENNRVKRLKNARIFTTNQLSPFSPSWKTKRGIKTSLPRQTPVNSIHACTLYHRVTTGSFRFLYWNFENIIVLMMYILICPFLYLVFPPAWIEF